MVAWIPGELLGAAWGRRGRRNIDHAPDLPNFRRHAAGNTRDRAIGYQDYEGTVADFRRLLDDASIKLVAVYSGGNFIFPDILDEELARIVRAADAAAAAGAEHIVVGGGAKRVAGLGPDDHKRLGTTLELV